MKAAKAAIAELQKIRRSNSAPAVALATVAVFDASFEGIEGAKALTS
jgi:hypothetical protein